VFIVEDTLKKQALFNGNTKKFITGFDYDDIELFRDGLAVVKKAKTDGGYSFGAIDNKGTVVIPLEHEFLGSYSDGLICFEKDSKFGYIDRNNTVVIPAMYANIAAFGNGLAPVQDPVSQQYGYIDKTNQMVIPAKYIDADNFYEGFATVKMQKAGIGHSTQEAQVALIDAKGKELTDFSYNYISMRQPSGLFFVRAGKMYGAIDETGKLIVPVEYQMASPKADKYFELKTRDNKYGLMNNKAVFVLKPEYDYISSPTNDRMTTKKGNMYGVIDNDLKTIIPADSGQLVTIGQKRIVFYGMDKVKVYDMNGKLQQTISQPKVKSFGSTLSSNEDSLILAYDAALFIASIGQSARPMPYAEVGDFNEDGICIAKGTDNKYYFLDQTGKRIYEKGYYAAVNFSEGICALQETGSASSYLADKSFVKIKNLTTAFKGPYSEGIAQTGNGYGTGLVYIDKSGNNVFTLTAAEGGECKDGRIWIQDAYKNYYYVDKSGHQIGEDMWPGIRLYSDGLSAVYKDNKWGFIDKDGKYVIQPKYEEASSFFNGSAIVKDNGKYMLINKKAQQVGTATFTGAAEPGIGGFPVAKGIKVGLVDGNGNTVIDFKYDNVLPLKEGRTWAFKNGKCALVDDKGKELTGFIYTTGAEFKNGYALVSAGGKAGLVDKNGKLVLATEYNSIGSVYKGMVMAMKAGGTASYSLK
ncbi:MAG TPA: WG repeat-containing protein, partial [Ferruginibacter sp.]|nr:WG repeat-containing protein [Ferruginibacter sp.]